VNVRAGRPGPAFKPWTFALVGAITLTACSIQAQLHYYDADKKTAEAAMQVLHEHVSKEQYDAAYEDTSEAMRATASKAQLIAGMRATHEQFGAFHGATLKAASCFPEEVRLILHVDYANGPATEMATWHVRDGVAKLVMFHINPGIGDVADVKEHSCEPS
jgi:hypothetical protein